jgi:hypothetical protein
MFPGFLAVFAQRRVVGVQWQGASGQEIMEKLHVKSAERYKNILSAITAIHHVIHRSRILNAQFAWHGSKLLAAVKSVNSED